MKPSLTPRFNRFYIRVPVQCNRGHAAFWYTKFDTFNYENIGVLAEEKCECTSGKFPYWYDVIGAPDYVKSLPETMDPEK